MQQNELIDDVCISVREKFNHLSLSPTERCISRVHDQLRKVNEKAYEPNIIAIGPYHRGKENLLMMEEHKLRYLQYFFQQREHESLLKYVVTLRKIEGAIRKCYAEPLEYINSSDFIEMMLLNGFFIVELVQKFLYRHLREENDPIFKVGWICYYLRRDLLLFENQIPFFVLYKLFDMTENSYPDKCIIRATSFFLGTATPIFNFVGRDPQQEEIMHLLELVHRKLLPSFENDLEANWKLIQCATELKRAGITFEKIEENNLFDIKFSDGVFQISKLIIDDDTESFFRNLVAYEQYLPDNYLHFVTDYLSLMGYLISSATDVKILRRSNIICSCIGDDESVSTMFNKIGDSVMVLQNRFCYARVFNKVNEHCSKPRNKWMAKLRREWAIISVITAFALFVLTLLQTVFTIMSYYL